MQSKRVLTSIVACVHMWEYFPRRLVSRPYHYSDKVKHVWLNNSDTILHINESDQITDKQSNTVIDGDKAMLAVEKRKEKQKVSTHLARANAHANLGWQNNCLKLTS